MTQILTDAEYERLTPIERAQYWNQRFHEAEEQRDQLQAEIRHLRRILYDIQESLNLAE